MASTPILRRRRPRPSLTGVVAAVVVSLAASACSSGIVGNSSSSTSSSTTSTTALDPGPGPTSLADADVRLQTIVAPLRADTPTSLPDGSEVTSLQVPTAMAARPGRNQLWIAERSGTVRMVTVNTEWDRTTGRSKRTGYTLLPGATLDLSALTDTTGERGLLGLAFSTDGRTLYVHHTALNGDVVVAAYGVSDKSIFSGGTGGRPPNADAVAVADPATRVDLLTIPHQRNSNHNGGQLALGPDGYLYVGVGDGGGSDDPSGNAQNVDTLLGKILRIDPATPNPVGPYSIPPDNPFVAGGGRAEVYLWGVRNPWRFSFDRDNGDLWVADVGQNSIEEIDWLPAASGAGRGANLGWNWFEGDDAFRTDGEAPDGLVGPLHTYAHNGDRCSITGGYVYRGTAVPDLDGAYVYGDYCSGEIRGLLARNGIVLDDVPLASVATNNLVSFGQDDEGELYVLSADGTLSRIVA